MFARAFQEERLPRFLTFAHASPWIVIWNLLGVAHAFGASLELGVCEFTFASFEALHDQLVLEEAVGQRVGVFLYVHLHSLGSQLQL